MAAAAAAYSSSWLILHQNPRIPSSALALALASSTSMAEREERRPNPSRRKKKSSSSYGTSRRSVIKKSFSQEQVTFATPLPADPAVAVIGGGIAGLACASALEDRGIRSTVFDTGMHGLGGRLGTRMVEFDGEELVFDHAAQFFTATDPRFEKFVERWLEEGLIREWKGELGELEAGGRFRPLPYTAARYIGAMGMRPLADSILRQSRMVEVMRPCWRLELSSIWALLAAFRDPLPVSCGAQSAFEGAFVKGVDSISWMANNTSKLYPSQRGLSQCWTFFSTAAYGKRNKVPQENIPTVTAERVKVEMIEGVETALGLSKGSLQRPFYTRVQLWGAALPTNTPGIPCIFNPHGRAGICGDWLLGSNVEDAVLSGVSLAHHMADYFQSGGAPAEEFEIGLHETFRAVGGHDIGLFHGFDSEDNTPALQASGASL